MPPRNKEDAKTLIRKRISDGAFLISPHAKKERDKDELTDVDIVNVLRGGIVDEAEFENGEWRHHVRTPTPKSSRVITSARPSHAPRQASSRLRGPSCTRAP